MEQKIQLLIVDDEADFLETIADRMEMRGFDVTKALNGAEAIEAVKKKKYDIALLDLKMPGLDGIEVLKILKDQHQYIEVIILTAHGSIETAFDASKIGAFGFLSKPYDFDELIVTIRNAFELRLKKKFENDKDKMDILSERISELSIGAESALDILEEMRKMDNDIK
jgi:DNA-binding NtrC family response regulator